MNPDPALIKKALDAIESGDDAAALEILKGLVAAAAGVPAEAQDQAEDAADGNGDTPPTAAQTATLTRGIVEQTIRTLTGAATAAEGVQEIAALRSRVGVLDAAASAAEHTERLGLVGELVTLGYEFPATAFSDPEKKTLAAHLAAEPIVAMRARLVTLRKQPRTTPGHQAPEGGGAPEGVVVQLTRAEKEALKKSGMSEQEFIAAKKNAVRRV